MRKNVIRAIYAINIAVFTAGYLFYIAGGLFRMSQKVFNVKSFPDIINKVYFSDFATAPFLIISPVMIVCAVVGAFLMKKYISKRTFIMLLLDYVPIALILFEPFSLSGASAQTAAILSPVVLILYFIFLLIFYLGDFKGIKELSV